jgi:DNA polymerase III epsilon subunit-like protein
MKPHELARTWLDAGCLVLDTETTGLDEHAEIVELALIDTAGNPLLDTLIKPQRPIPPDATDIHGITNADVQHAPDWRDVQPLLLDLIAGRTLVIYNANYDVRLMHQSARAAGIDRPPLHSYPCSDPTIMRAYCAMLMYAEWWGDYDDYRQSWRWQKLQTAAHRHGLPAPAAHRALSDCVTTLALLQHCATHDAFGDPI